MGKKVVTGLAIPFARDKLSRLVSNIASNTALNVTISNRMHQIECFRCSFENRISVKKTVKAGKVTTLCISNEDINDIIKIINSLEDSGVLIDGLTETVKQGIKNEKLDFLLPC